MSGEEGGREGLVFDIVRGERKGEEGRGGEGRREERRGGEEIQE